MMAAIFRALALLHLLPRLLAASACPDAACGAGEPAEEAALLQSISRRGDARSIPAVPPSLLSGAAPAPGSAGPYPVKCYAGQSTQCPGSSDQCAGNQCCPGIPWSGGKTFPCPSATSVEASNCASSQKAWYCAASSALQGSSTRRGDAQSIPAVPPSLLSGAAPAPGSAGPYPVKCYAGQSTQCPGSSDQCAGNQLLPRHPVERQQDLPVPIRHQRRGLELRQRPEGLVLRSVLGAAGQLDQEGRRPEAPGGAAAPAVGGSGMLGSAGPYPVKCYAGQSTQCPGSSDQCAGNQCCPGIPWSGNKTFPCPSAISVEASNCASDQKAWYCAASSGDARAARPGGGEPGASARPEGLVLRAVAAPQQSEFFGTSTWWVTGSALADVAAGYFCSPRSRSLNPPPTLAPSLFLPPFPSARWPKDRARSQSGSGASRCVAALGLNASPSHSSNGI
ncbi:unnamed protein product [Prorocentrum cordatum]|uniref:Cellulase n=1 Tax=Prorocentrum cordatum TaxID=2364126 RepID=A0ABN9QFJ5_9DINO|nr:unnamed protein product [Polarella glacialis]